MKGKRIFNNRPLCFVALFLALGLIIGEVMYPFPKLFRLIPTVLSLGAVIGLFSFAKTRKFGYIAVSFLVGIVAMCGANDVYDSRFIPMMDTKIQGTVDSEIILEDGSTVFYVKDIVVEGYNLDGRAYVTVYDGDDPDFRAGDVVVVDGTISFNDHDWFDTYYSVAVNKSSYYYIRGNYAVKVADGKPSFPLNLQLNIKQMFYDNMDEESAMICQALILGDKFGIDGNLYEGIKSSGLAHVLAVSGLHVTALASAILMLLKKTKLKPWISFVLVAIFTFFYVMLCGFTASSMRAYIMTLVLNYGVLFGYKYDKLSSLSLATIVLMLFRPQNIMDVGFLLSAFSVFGIFSYYPTFKGWGNLAIEKMGLGKRMKEDGKFLHFADKGAKKCLDGVVESASISMSANLMTFPLVGYSFQSVPVLFALSNIVILPYMMFIFIFLIVITLFCQLTTLWAVVSIMQILLLPLRWWTEFIGSISWASIDAPLAIFFMIAWLVVAVCSSKFIFIERKGKIVTSSLLMVLFLIINLVALILQ